MENRLMTIVFIDMQGYTRRSASQTIEEMKLFHDQMFKFVSDIVDRCGGVMVKTMGDGFMVRFDSPTNAVQTGIEIQKKLESRNAQMMTPDSIVRFRIGINTGEVGIDESGDLFGDPVNIAARIQTFADSNDVFISEATYLAMNRNEFGAVDLGAQELKNATREIKIYKILKNGSPGVTLPGAKKPVAPSQISNTHKKLIVAVAVGGLILVTLVAGFFLGSRKNRKVEQQHKPDSIVEHNQLDPILPIPPDSQHAAAPENKRPVRERKVPLAVRTPNQMLPRQGGDTLLTADPFKLQQLNLDEHERRVIGDVQSHFHDGHYSQAETICSEMMRRAGNKQKPVFALLLAEVFWMQKKTSDAEQIFSNIRNLRLPAGVKKRLETAIVRIKKHSID